MTVNEINNFIIKLEDFIKEYNLLDDPKKSYDAANSVLTRAQEYVLSTEEFTQLFIKCNGENPNLLIDYKDSVFTIRHFLKDMPAVLKKLTVERLKLRIQQAIDKKQPVDLIISYRGSDGKINESQTYSAFLILSMSNSSIQGHTIDEREKGKEAVISTVQLDIIDDVI
ncbi:hypothetical protein SAMN05660841_04076 [Sphingobacterium nematocida]|uniref:Uncharacterized protein n=1 Tax=Sphingobacterium nematocida TaxID=1513896 RepID=A0A1T5GHV2_9SPHI|nr:hypothetical protein [Sphingobacterium nematocida]SKC07956.1 hypothetical protein SAMN05660841_04076 [Sphingobacterium nematocida]